MARPQRNNVDYFPHYISEGKKMFYIEQKYGNDGYAMWFKLLETLAITDYHYVNLGDETERMFLAAKCRVTVEVLMDFLTDLSKLKEINFDLWDSVKVVWSDKFIDSISDAYSKRSNNCMSLESLRSHLLSLGILKGDVKPQSKVKESKVKNTILKESKKEGLVFPFDSENFKNQWELWKDYKLKEFKFKYKTIQSEQAALTSLNNLADGNEQVAIQIIHQSFANSWKGFFELKKDNNGKSTNERIAGAAKEHIRDWDRF